MSFSLVISIVGFYFIRISWKIDKMRDEDEGYFFILVLRCEISVMYGACQKFQ